MEPNTLPPFSFDAPETDCCPPFDPAPWDNQTITLDDKLFVRGTTCNLFHIPITMGGMMEKNWELIKQADAASADQWLLLSHDLSPWKGEHFFWVTKDVPGAEMVHLTGTFRTMVFEGPYSRVSEWQKEVTGAMEKEGKKVEKVYWYYTTCPKCLKHYGKNYVVAFAKVG